MKNLFRKSKYVLVFVLCIMLFGFMNVYAEGINEITINGIKEPKVGDTVSSIITDIKVPENVNYTIVDITWWESENGMYFGNMSEDNTFEDGYCYHYSITLKANDGFEFPVDENDSYTGILSTNDLGYEMAQIDNEGNLDIVGEDIIFGDITYQVKEGANQTVKSDSDATFRVDADYDLFEDGFIIVDEDRVDPKFYEVSEGSTIITLKKEFIETLTEGEHRLFVVFGSNYKYAETKFTVTKNKETNAEINEKENKVEIPNTEISSPVPEENIMGYVVMLLLSTLGLSGTILLKK